MYIIRFGSINNVRQLAGFKPIEHPNKYSKEMISTLGKKLFTEIIDQMLDHGMVHSDAHPGNFAFRSDGKIVFYDLSVEIILCE